MSAQAGCGSPVLAAEAQPYVAPLPLPRGQLRSWRMCRPEASKPQRVLGSGTSGGGAQSDPSGCRGQIRVRHRC